MNERDELAETILRHYSDTITAVQARNAANAAINAGFRKPRTITTAKELDEMSVGSVILDVERDAWQKRASGVWWCADQVNGAPTGYLPATVLHEGNQP